MSTKESKIAIASIHILPGAGDVKIWGMTPEQRLEKQLSKAGIDTDAAGQTALFFRGDVVFDMAVIKGLAGAPGTLVVDEDGTPIAAHVPAEEKAAAEKWLQGKGGKPETGMNEQTPAEVGGAYNHMLRKRDPARCYKLTPETVRDVEWQLYKASYKGVTDLVTKYVWPVPAYHVTRLCAKLGLTPNMVTTVGAILMFAALWLFWEGHYGWGLLAGWIMTFLDTVDGKLARVTITSSKWGNIFDHGIDLLHPPFWYIAWGIGLVDFGTPLPEGWLGPILWTMFIFYVAGRLIEGYFMRRFGMHLHVWRRFDSWFRLILARRNPNMIVMTIFWMIGRPDIALVLITFWHVATFAVHCVQLLQAEVAKSHGKAVQSWLSA